ncbi:MAG TPA: hypothetical protein IGS17_11950 [Oscillatoriales cyanobacterium M59_W2019_021]|nr:MAG: hypothetical protein D6728_15275 [Cyanobacteria bacterium J055]HIK33799.1 hypothetical protein [Oscillatoriales cyanobacterium M4454_W2019_049]HIK51615.1 hypothetical protein [Oscillatoriales cyanobacterium M59_W2019_021]
MKTLTCWLVLPIALGLVSLSVGAAVAETIELSPDFAGLETTTGTSGGAIDTGNCGYISNTPNHQLILSEDFDYLRVAVTDAEGLTLLVRGSDSEFCAPRDPQQSGYWPKGTYEIFVGDRARAGHPYTLSISTTP